MRFHVKSESLKTQSRDKEVVPGNKISGNPTRTNFMWVTGRTSTRDFSPCNNYIYLTENLLRTFWLHFERNFTAALLFM